MKFILPIAGIVFVGESRKQKDAIAILNFGGQWLVQHAELLE